MAGQENAKKKIEMSKHKSNGQILDFLIKSLEVYQKEEKLQKVYQRFLLESEIATEEYYDTQNTIIEDVLHTFFEDSDNKEYIYYESLINEFLTYYSLYKLHNETLATSQKQLDFISIITIFIPFLSHMTFDGFIKNKKDFDLIDSILPDEKETSIQKLLSRIESTFQSDANLKDEVYAILDTNYKDYNLAKENYNNWINGDNVPNQGHINLLSTLAKFSNKFSQMELKTYFQFAKIIQYLYTKSKAYFGIELTSLIVKHYKMISMICILDVMKNLDLFIGNLPLKNRELFELYLEGYYNNSLELFSMLGYFSQHYDYPDKTKGMTEHIKKCHDDFDILFKMREEVFFRKIEAFLPIKFFNRGATDIAVPNLGEEDIDKEFFEFSKLLSKLYEHVAPSNKKNKSSETDFLSGINELEKKFDIKKDPYSLFMKARFYAQKRDYKQSTKLYLQALEYGKGSIGVSLKDLIKEGLIVSAQDTRKEQLDLIQAKSSFTKFYKEAYFYKLIANLPEEINIHFLLDMKKQFDIYFKNLFPNVKVSSSNNITSNFSAVLRDDIENVKIDFKNPNKWIKNVYSNKITQLMHCCQLSKINEVKKLLKGNVDVNAKKLNDNCTALISSFGNDYHTTLEQIEIMKLLIPKMSVEALNAKLIKKKQTAMSYAIEKGFVDIVELLIQHGVNVDEKCTIDEMSYLYYCIQLIKFSNTTTEDFKSDMKRGMHKIHHSHKEQEKIKNSNNLINNIFNNDISLEETKYFKNGLVDSVVSELYHKKHRQNRENYYKIFDLLIENVSSVDTKEINGFSPLIYATETNDEYLVERLLQKDANPDFYNNGHYRAYDYAEINKNEKLMDLLS